uniref:Uncharacterized protein n=1 Tax=Aplanochytrium stocchinoi TaxID=215587 RepID=A0A7S3UYX5_9STRA
MAEGHLPMVAISNFYYNLKPAEDLMKIDMYKYSTIALQNMSNVNSLAAATVASNSTAPECDFTLLVSFDQKKEEITGRGLIVSLDAKVAFDTLKATIGDYLKSINISPQMNIAQLENKKRFWKGLREYCQSRVRGSMDGMHWAIRVWAGYPLYQVPMSNATNTAFLFQLKTNTVSGDSAEATRECTVTHKQLHDMVNKQFRKFTLGVEQEMETLKSAAAMHPSQQLIDPAKHLYAYAPSSGSIGSFNQHAAGFSHGLPPLQRDHSQHNLSLHLNTINNSANGVTASSMKLIELQQQIPNYPTAGGAQMNIGHNTFAQLPHLHNIQYPNLTRRFSADKLVMHNMSNNHSKPNSTDSRIAQSKDLNEMLSDFKKLLNETKHLLKDSDRLQMKNELHSIIRSNLSTEVRFSGSKRSRSEIDTTPIKRAVADQSDDSSYSDTVSTPDNIPYKDARWTDAEEAIMIGLGMECYLLHGTHNWEKIAKCFEAAWKKFCSENNLTPQTEAKSPSLIAQHFKSLKKKIQSKDEKRSLMSFLNTWKDVYNKGNRLIDTESTYSLDT